MHRIAELPRWVRWIVAALAAFASTEIAGAACTGLGPDFGQVSANCNGAYCYVVSPGQHTPQTLAGTFWNFGAGQPAISQGQDNGSWPVGSWLLPSSSNLYFAGGWQTSAAIDGCISGTIAPGKPAEIMVAEVSDEGFGAAFFAVASARRVIGAVPEFDFTFVNGGGAAHDVTLAPIPRPRVTSSGPGQLLHIAGPTLADVSPGVFGDGSLAPGEIVKGYRLYQTQSSVTSHRTSAGWTPITGIVPLGQETLYTIPACTPSEQINLGLTLVFDGNFETAHVGQVTHISCRYCVFTDADGDGHFFLTLESDGECCPDPSVCDDCNDSNATMYPGAPELCDGLDNNCNGFTDEQIATPGAVAALHLDKQPGTTRLTWPPLVVATGYDVVRGDLTSLSISGGSFSAATQACVTNDVATSQVDDAENPDPGYGFWYLLRAGNCAGAGSYDDPTRAAARDAGIAASGHACP